MTPLTKFIRRHFRKALVCAYCPNFIAECWIWQNFTRLKPCNCSLPALSPLKDDLIKDFFSGKAVSTWADTERESLKKELLWAAKWGVLKALEAVKNQSHAPKHTCCLAHGLSVLKTSEMKLNFLLEELEKE